MSQDTTAAESGGKLPQSRSVALVAVGSNSPFQGLEPANTILSAVEKMRDSCGSVAGVSDFFATPAYPLGNGPDFVNAAAVLETSLDAADLLRALHAIEAKFGRQRTARWAPRTLDLDLVGYGAVIAPDLATFERWRDLDLDQQLQQTPEHLVLPHPRLAERAFVLVPLAQALQRANAPWCHPVSGETVEALISALPQADIDQVRPL